jgi:type III secretion protein C
MKRYLPSHVIIKLSVIIANGFAFQALKADISDSLHRHNLIKEWNRETSKASFSNSFQNGIPQNFFSVEADFPSSKSTAPKESVEHAVKDFNNALNEALSHSSHEASANGTPEDQFQDDRIQPQDVPYPASWHSAEVAASSYEAKQSNYANFPLISQADSRTSFEATTEPSNNEQSQPILIRFNNVSIIEYLRFLSGILRKNFILDENDLQFNITMISEEPTSIEDFMTALLQELRIHDLTLLEQGNNLVIHKNPKVTNVSTVITDDPGDKKTYSELVTQVFRLNTADAEKVAAIVRPLISEGALVEVIKDTNHIILTDLVTNVMEIGKLIRTLDSPKGGLVIGQYVVRTSTIDALLPIVQQLMGPISADQSIQYVPYTPSNSIFVVSTPFLVERSLSILQHLDQNQKSTKIFDLKDLQYDNEDRSKGPAGTKPQPIPPAGLFINDIPFEPSLEPATPAFAAPDNTTIESGQPSGWKIDNQGNWSFKVLTQQGQTIDPNRPPQGKWSLDKRGNWLFIPGAAPTSLEEDNQPKGSWMVDLAGNWEFELDKNEGISVNVISRSAPEKEELLPGQKPKGQFFLHKVHYRKGEELQRSLQAMSDSLRDTENVDIDLVNALMSAQWLESSNSIVFSGTPEALQKISILIEEIDVPLRQVFIEMLILEATLVDALNYSVKWANRFGGGNWAGGDGFDSTFPSPMSSAINSTGVNNLGQPIQINPATGLPVLGQVLIPNPTPFNGTPGFDIGIIGQRIFNKLTGIEFESIGAFLNALRGITTSNIILNPKIITEDGVPAEIFVGENIAYQTQSIVNDQGVILTSNFEYRDVGTRLKVTPYLGANDIIALEIENEITNVISNAQAGLPANSNVGPNTSKSSTVTRVHIPSGFFLVISGMLRDETRRTDAHAPCLGGIPVLGAAFKDKKYEDQKRNIMIFIQPKIIDTDEEMQCLTKHQQDLLKFKNRRKKDMLYETEEFMDFINLKKYEHERTSIEFEDDEEPL